MCFGVFVQVNGETRFSEKHPIGYVIQENGCWDWVGNTGPSGYGKIKSRGRNLRAHRWMYEQVKGEIPSGLTLDHLCRRPICVNPDHLEPVTTRENTMRGLGFARANAEKTHCIRGHDLVPGNIYVPPGKKPGRSIRMCILCLRARKREYTERRRRARMERGPRPNCPKGHRYTPENTTIYKNHRNCLVCERGRKQRWAKKREARK